MDMTTLRDASAAVKPASGPQAEGDAIDFEPILRGESQYDRVTSMLMSIVIGTALIVGWFFVIFITMQEYRSKAPAPIAIVEVFGGGGGSPDGTIGASEAVDVPGAEAGSAASNAPEDNVGTFEEPSVEAVSSAAIDPSAVASSDEMAEGTEIQAEMKVGGTVATGRRRSKIGTGGRGLGLGGPGDGGVSREQRWMIIYPAGQSADDYAKQLDFLKVELATIGGSNTLVYGSNFSAAPIRRTGLSAQEKRLYFIQTVPARIAFDVELLKRAGIDAKGRPIFAFYPSGVEQQLSQLEVAYKGRQPGEIRQTRFSVVQGGSGYTFQVVSQETLR